MTWVLGIMDIFEGTEQIQQLVISRAISGLRIEWRSAGRRPGCDMHEARRADRGRNLMIVNIR